MEIYGINKGFFNKINENVEKVIQWYIKKINHILNIIILNLIEEKNKKRRINHNAIKIKYNIKEVSYKNRINLFICNLFLFIIINPILAKKANIININLDSELIIKLKVSSGEKMRIINSNFLPNKIYINGISSTIDRLGNINIKNNKINNVTLEYNEIINKFDKMFQNLNSIIEVDLSNIDTSEVTSMKAMFINCANLRYINLKNFDTSSVDNMSQMFEGCNSLTSLDLSSFKTSKVNNMNNMFKNCHILTSLDITNFDTSNLRKMQEMFSGCNSLKSLDLSSLNTNGVGNMDLLFFNCNSLTSINIINFLTKNVKTMKEMFRYCTSLISLDLSKFDTSRVTNMNNMFYGCKSLISLNLSNFITSKVIDMDNMFYGCNSLKILDLLKFNTLGVNNMEYMFFECHSLISLDLSSFNLYNKTMKSFLNGCTSLKNIKFPKSNILPHNIDYMFFNCSSLTTLDLSNFNLSLVESTEFLFYNCSSLISLDLSNIDSYSIYNMEYMFYACVSLKAINFTNFITPSVITINSMFESCSSLTSLDLSSFNTSLVYNMKHTFSNCNNLAKINLSSFDTSHVLSMNSMFSGCNSLTSLDLSNFNTSLVIEMNKMFYGCNKLISLDLSSFNTKNTINANSMFYGCSKLNYINFYYFNESISDFEEIFLGASDNLIICINNKTSDYLISELSLKQCIINNCSFNINNNEKKINYHNRKCRTDCLNDKIYKYEFESFCYDKCPKGTHPIDDKTYSCENNIYECFENYPFLIIEDNICSDSCDSNEFFNNICTINNINSGYSTIINNIINEIQGGSLDELFEKVLNEKEDIIKFENNILYQLTTSFNQKNKNYQNISVIKFGECEDMIKKYYTLPENETLLIFKTEKYFNDSLIPLIEYEIFAQETKQKLNFTYCNETNNISINIPVSINEDIIFKYESNSTFYNDICNTYRTEDGTDIIIYDRQSEYNNNNKSLCPKNCIYKGYNFDNKTAFCLCKYKDRILFSNINNEELLFKFSLVKKFTNFEVLKCYSLLFSKKGLIKNIGNYIISIVIILYIISGIYFYIKGFNKIYDKINVIINKKIFDNNSIIDYKIELKDESKENTTDIISRKSKISDNLVKSKLEAKFVLENSFKMTKINCKSTNNINNNQIKKDIIENEIITDYDLNNISFKEALNKDKRTYIQFYISLLKEKHILISIIYLNKKYNDFMIKICLLFFSFVLNLVINTIFFNDSLMHQIYVDKGIYNFVYNIPILIYSIIIYSIIILFIKKLSLYENSLLEIKQEKNKYNIKGKVLIILKCLIIKYICFFVFGMLLLLLFWCYLSSFCAVYNNTQIYLIKNSLISYVIIIIYPFIIYLLPGIFRITALKCSGPCFYKISQIIQLLC